MNKFEKIELATNRLTEKGANNIVSHINPST